MKKTDLSAVLLLFTSLLLTYGTAWAREWKADHAQSKLGFVATYDNIAFEAWFKKYDARIVFDPAEVSKSSFEVSVDVRSVDSDSSDRDEGMQGAEWFDTQQFPRATFTSTGVQTTDKDAFTVKGKLIIKNLTNSVAMPFSWSVDPQKHTARLSGEMALKRTDFNIGTGAWARDPIIGFDVKVRVDLLLIEQ